MCTKLNKSQAQIHCYKYLHTKKIEWKILASFRGCTTIYHVCVFTAQTALSSVHWFCTLREQTKSVHITMKKSQKLIGNICWWRKDKKQSPRNNKWQTPLIHTHPETIMKAYKLWTESLKQSSYPAMLKKTPLIHTHLKNCPQLFHSPSA